MSKIEATSKVSLKLTSRIKPGRRGTRVKPPTLYTVHKTPDTAHKTPQPGKARAPTPQDGQTHPHNPSANSPPAKADKVFEPV